jgi:DNA repair protein REV1
MLCCMQRELGEKTGENLWLMAHGRDNRVVQTPKPRKSLGAEVNWGIRFRNQQDADTFLLKLSGEV